MWNSGSIQHKRSRIIIFRQCSAVEHEDSFVKLADMPVSSPTVAARDQKLTTRIQSVSEVRGEVYFIIDQKHLLLPPPTHKEPNWKRFLLVVSEHILGKVGKSL